MNPYKQTTHCNMWQLASFNQPVTGR